MKTDQFMEKNGSFVARSYRQYLALESITSKRKFLSEINGGRVHDELLFILIHQNIELWFLQALEEAREARRLIAANELRLAIDELDRIGRIFSVLTVTWDVLATLRPREFWRFREFFGGASGFQSAQFRELEYAFGLRADFGRDIHIHAMEIGSKADCEKLWDELNRPSLWDEVNLALERNDQLKVALGQMGLALPTEVRDRDWTLPYPRKPSVRTTNADEEPAKGPTGYRAVEEAWFLIYSDRASFRDLYDLGEQLADLSAAFSSWRYKHIMTVERFIGRLPGSAKDSDGIPYLLTTLEKRPFPELWSVRSRFNRWSAKRYKEDEPSL